MTALGNKYISNKKKNKLVAKGTKNPLGRAQKNKCKLP